MRGWLVRHLGYEGAVFISFGVVSGALGFLLVAVAADGGKDAEALAALGYVIAFQAFSVVVLSFALGVKRRVRDQEHGRKQLAVLESIDARLARIEMVFPNAVSETREAGATDVLAGGPPLPLERHRSS